MERKLKVLLTAPAARAMAGAAATAHAETHARARADTAAVAGTLLEPAPARRALRWEANGRWGLNLEVQQPIGREADWGDVEAGAYFRVSPSVRVGGSVDLGESRVDPARPTQDPRSQPRIRLETTFRF